MLLIVSRASYSLVSFLTSKGGDCRRETVEAVRAMPHSYTVEFFFKKKNYIRAVENQEFASFLIVPSQCTFEGVPLHGTCLS